MSEPITHGPTGLINWKARAKAAEAEIKALKADNDTFRAIANQAEDGLAEGESKLARLEGLERAARDWASGKDKGGAMFRDAARAYASENE